jgi:predicted RNA-binding protein with PIN domain
MPAGFLIDGYNLLHFAGLGRKRFRPGEFEQARDRLLRRIAAGLTPEELARTVVVFDAQYAPHADRRPQPAFGMTVLFSPRGRQADDAIEVLLLGGPAGRDLTVVSSDRRLLLAARQARASALDSDSFLVELDRRQEAAARARQSDKEAEGAAGDPPVTDWRAWLKEFGEIDVAEIMRGEQTPSAAAPVEAPPRSGPSPAAPPAQKPPAENPPQEGTPGDLDFWERRVRELFDEEAEGR